MAHPYFTLIYSSCDRNPSIQSSSPMARNAKKITAPMTEPDAQNVAPVDETIKRAIPRSIFFMFFITQSSF